MVTFWRPGVKSILARRKIKEDAAYHKMTLSHWLLTHGIQARYELQVAVKHLADAEDYLQCIEDREAAAIARDHRATIETLVRTRSDRNEILKAHFDRDTAAFLKLRDW